MKNIVTQPGFLKKLSVIIVLFLSCCSLKIYAQDEDEGDEDGGVEAQDRPDPDAPLDGGVILLLTGGVGYGLMKAYQYNKKQQKNTIASK